MLAGEIRKSIDRAVRITAIGVVLSLLAACQTSPSPQAQASGDEQAAAEQPAQGVTDTDQPPALTFPAEELILSCPEPEPVPVPVCPPAPKPKPCPVCPESKLEGKMILGDVEKVRFDPPGVTYTARIDSGAAGTSIHATNIVRFERDGEKWVRFDLDSTNGEPITMEREVVRRVRVRQVELDEFERRLVVLMTMTLGSMTEQVEFSLNDRSDMEHPVLIGRNFLRNNAIVDVSQEFIAK